MLGLVLDTFATAALLSIFELHRDALRPRSNDRLGAVVGEVEISFGHPPADHT